MSALQDKYIFYAKPVDGKAEIKKGNGDTIVVDIDKALPLANKMHNVRKYIGLQAFTCDDHDYTDASLVDLVRYQNGYIMLYTKEHSKEEYLSHMLLVPEKLYTGESTVFDVFRESLNHMMEKLKALEFEEYAAEIID